MRKFFHLIVLLFLSIIVSNAQNNSETTQNTNTMKSHIAIFEIPATNITRAVDFYKAVLDLQIETMEMSGMKIGIFPYENHAVTGIITEAEGFNPSADGITIYLNAGDNLQVTLDKVEANGGKTIVPKTPHADEQGFFAIFIDSEGNRMGLHSTN